MKSVELNDFRAIYFLGIGGIGMSALARYFHQQGKIVGGYDKTATQLTAQLISEGIPVHYEDLGSNIPDPFNNKENTIVVITPAIPHHLGERTFLMESGFPVLKRAEVLGLITRNSIALTVAGTHGKTTTSTLLAHILQSSEKGCNAFLGGISSNYNSNYLSHETSPYTVIEADEFDRSFLQLTPHSSIITSADPDHLDIYGDANSFRNGFVEFAARIDRSGYMICHVDVDLEHPNKITYGLDTQCDYMGQNLRFENEQFLFDLQTPYGWWRGIELGIPGIHNAENAIACVALALKYGLNEDEIRNALASYKGVKRRFEYHLRSKDLVYIDDYAHHPTEIAALISSVRLLYPERPITGIFQPHLFTRTNDLMSGFAKELSKLDRCILLPIYPAREEPIAGVTSEVLLERVTAPEKMLVRDIDLIDTLDQIKPKGVLLTIGAGDIDRLIKPINELLLK